MAPETQSARTGQGGKVGEQYCKNRTWGKVGRGTVSEQGLKRESVRDGIEGTSGSGRYKNGIWREVGQRL